MPIPVDYSSVVCSLYPLTATPEAGGDFHLGFSSLIQGLRSTDILAVIGEFNAQLTFSADIMRNIGVSFLFQSFPTVAVLSNFLLAVYCLIKISYVRSAVALSSFYSYGHRLIALSSIIVGMDHSGLDLRTRNIV